MTRFLLNKFWLLCAGLIVLFAVVLSIARLLLPYSDYYHDEIEHWLSGAIGQPVRIEAISAQWHGFGPRLVLSGLNLLNEDTREPLIRFTTVGVDLDIPRSVLRGTPAIGRLVLSEVRFTVERDAEGGLTVAGRGLPRMQPDAARSDTDSSRLLDWLLSQGRLGIEGAEIVWTDHVGGETEQLVFTGVNLELRNRSSRHQLEGSAELPSSIGQQIVFAADIKGDLRSDDWRGRLYAQGIGLDLGRLLVGRELGGLGIAEGSAEAKLWAKFTSQRLEELEGRVSGSGIALRPVSADGRQDRSDSSSGRHRFETISADLAWRDIGAGWRFDISRLDYQRDGRTHSSAALAVERLQMQDGGVISARAESVYLEDFSPLLRMSRLSDESVRDAIAQLAPIGRLKSADFRHVSEAADSRFAIQAAVEDFSNSPWAGFPGMNNVSADLVVNQDAGVVDIEAGRGVLDFADLFRDPLSVAGLQGRIEWWRDGGGWRLRLPRLDLHNPDLQLTAWGSCTLPAEDSSPRIALYARFTAAGGEHTSRYLPVRIMHPKAVSWLDRSIQGGSSPRGELVLHGPLDAFPFDGGTGRFKVDFDVENGKLQYHPEWPAISGITANVLFEGRQMVINASDGRSMSSRITDARVAIPELTGKPAVLEVDGKIDGHTADALRYLRETPLADRFGAYFRDAVAAGDSSLDLRLSVPLDGARVEVDGDLRFDDSALILADGAVDVTGIDGLLHFSDTGLSAEDISAKVLGLPAQINISPHLEDGSAGARIEAAGNTNAAAIAGLVDIPPLRNLEGDTDWHARLRIPFNEEPGYRGVGLRIESDLEGLAIRLPEPVTKPAETALPLLIEIPLPREPDLPVYLRLGETLSAVFTLEEGLGLERGELRFGGGDVTLPAQPGLRIVGSAGYISYGEWAGVFSGGSGEGGAPLGEINSVDLRVEKMTLFGRDFNSAAITAHRDANRWAVDVSSDEMTGRITAPQAEGQTWRANLEHLHLAALGTEAAPDEVIDPRRLPPMEIDCERFSYGETELGRLTLVSSKRTTGIHMDRLLLSSRQMRIEARGDWVVAGGRQFSSFHINFDTDDFGTALTQFGYADTIRGGKGNSTVAARWNGPPTGFALDRLDGSMEIDIRDGQLLDVEPGAGRIFGLISLQALPRRLTLDFSDFFGRGFSFDRISGKFVVRDGVATTSNLSLNGPAAKVEASGRIDIADRQYDQIVDVYPNVTSGLPVAGAVAGGIGLGAAILLMEQLFKPDIEQMTKLTYQVSGPWSDPAIQRLQDGGQSGKR